MLRELTKWEEIEPYLDFAYALALDVTRSGYPTYRDGVKTKEDFCRKAREALERENKGVLLFEREGEVLGWVQYFCIPEDNYFSTEVFVTRSHTALALEEFLTFGAARYPQCDIWLGFPAENREAVEYLEAHGVQRMDTSQHEMFFFEDYELLPESRGIRRVTEENFQDFRALHDPIAEDMYWNSDRLLEALGQWKIYLAYENGSAAAAMYWTDEKIMQEVFGADFSDQVFREAPYRDLLVKCLNECSRSGAKALCYFMGDDERRIAAPYGFRHIGEYTCWRKPRPEKARVN